MIVGYCRYVSDMYCAELSIYVTGDFPAQFTWPQRRCLRTPERAGLFNSRQTSSNIIKHHAGFILRNRHYSPLHPRGKYWPSSAVGQDSVTIHCALFIVHSIGGTESRSYLTLDIAQLIGACSQHRAERQKQKPRKGQALPDFFRF